MWLKELLLCWFSVFHSVFIVIGKLSDQVKMCLHFRVNKVLIFDIPIVSINQMFQPEGLLNKKDSLEGC